MFMNLKSDWQSPEFSLEQNIIDTAVNEWEKCLHACVCTMRPYSKQFYRKQLKNKTVG